MNHPIRVLHVVHTLARGGAEQQLLQVVQHTDPTAFRHHVCHFSGPATLASEILDAGHELSCLEAHSRRPWLQGALRLRRVHRSGRFDLANSWGYDADIATRMAFALGGRIPLVTSIQAMGYDPDAIELLGWPKNRVRARLLLERASIRVAKPAMVACSHFVAESTARHLPIDLEDVQVIYNTFDPGRVRAEPNAGRALRGDLGIPHGALVFLNVGRLAPEKGQDELLRAFQQVRLDLPPHLVVAGAGPLEEQLGNLARELGIEARVHLVGGDRNIASCLDMANVFVFPSRTEGFGIALAEAMAAGLAPIVSDVGSLVEVVGGPANALIFPVGSSVALAESMNRLAHEHRLRDALGNNAQRVALQQFDPVNVIPQWEAVYTRLAAA